jgi:hypothetical protein
MTNTSNDLNPEVYLLIYQLLKVPIEKELEKKLGTEYVKKYGEKFVEYAKNTYKEYQKELQRAHNKLPEAYGKTLDALLLNIDNTLPCKEETCLDPYDLHKRSRIFQYIYTNHFKTNIIRSINKHLKGLDPTQPNYDKEIKNIRDVLISLSEPAVYKTLFVAYVLVEYEALLNILSTSENSSINNKMFEQIKHLKASNDVQNYIRVIQDYIQKQIEWVNLAYQKSSKYIEDTIEELFRKNVGGFVEKIANVLLRYNRNSS